MKHNDWYEPCWEVGCSPCPEKPIIRWRLLQMAKIPLSMVLRHLFEYLRTPDDVHLVTAAFLLAWA